MQVFPSRAPAAPQVPATNRWANLPERGKTRAATMARLTLGVPDNGAYSTRGTGKGGLLVESAVILRALQAGAMPAEIRAAVLAGRLLHQRARVTREGIFKCLAHRLLNHGQPWIYEVGCFRSPGPSTSCAYWSSSATVAPGSVPTRPGRSSSVTLAIMSNELRCDGKVALITGAANGLGRAHAFLFASRGILSPAPRIATTPDMSRTRTCANLCSGTGAIP